ncbi:DUF1349 domain-containing protein [Oscillatoria sp. FACHB-1407]|uniref:DUF1349 domain-containing protein n=1 Tax=Oscillatoria sp. FACHB-1407 TaxID=2692847 RepID=UPI001687AABC|nr:DUF1349 domain-containing protein [Oscillatoria sp. FACHB-1407]MBD2461255.1 DUF1349 domain-containing protein [Oscillatoria sp. FACHB-1407]
MQWYNEPPDWRQEGDVLHITTGAKTDFWRKTHYGFIRDDGHFYYQEVTGNFTADVKITGHYQVLYDQAGIMVRESETVWLKCGIEFVEEVQNISAVVTRDFSDWSVTPLLNPPTSLWLRVQRRAEAIEVQYSLDGSHYQLLRLTYLTGAETVQVGLMAASPQGEGCAIAFEGFHITQP